MRPRTPANSRTRSGPHRRRKTRRALSRRAANRRTGSARHRLAAGSRHARPPRSETRFGAHWNGDGCDARRRGARHRPGRGDWLSLPLRPKPRRRREHRAPRAGPRPSRAQATRPRLRSWSHRSSRRAAQTRPIDRQAAARVPQRAAPRRVVLRPPLVQRSCRPTPSTRAPQCRPDDRGDVRGPTAREVATAEASRARSAA